MDSLNHAYSYLPILVAGKSIESRGDEDSLWTQDNLAREELTRLYQPIRRSVCAIVNNNPFLFGLLPLSSWPSIPPLKCTMTHANAPRRLSLIAFDIGRPASARGAAFGRAQVSSERHGFLTPPEPVPNHPITHVIPS